MTEQIDSEEEAPAPPPPRLYRARLDAQRIYWGVEEIAEAAAWDAEAGTGDFLVPVDCDLRPGAYRLAAPDAHSAAWHFAPLPVEQARPAQAVPSLEAAFYAVITNTRPEDVAAWRTWFESTLDGK